MKKNFIPEELRRALHEAAEKGDLEAFIAAIDANIEALPDDLVYARTDMEVIEEAMNLIAEGLATIEPDGIRLKLEDGGGCFPNQFH